MSSPHALYRLFDETGQLLYVGISVDPGKRFAQHRSDKAWWSDVRTMNVQPMPNRRAALDAEREAIKNERPLHNVVHNETPAASSSEVGRLLNMADDFVLAPVLRALGADRYTMRTASELLWTAACEYERAYKYAIAAGHTPDEDDDPAVGIANDAIKRVESLYLSYIALPGRVNVYELAAQARREVDEFLRSGGDDYQ